MACYRTPQSLNARFTSSRASDGSESYAVEQWLRYHGDTLKKRFLLSAYGVMTHLTATIGVCTESKELSSIASDIHLVSIDSDLLFTHDRAQATYEALVSHKTNTSFHTIHSIHGHDAFLMEYEQLNRIVQPYFPTPL